VKKVLVIGCPGAGKSYFARRLHDCTGLPLYHLDLIWHRPDKTHITREEFDARLREIFAEEAWILDGDFSRTMEVRMAACDTILFFDLPYEACMAGIRAREGTKRPDMPWAEARADEGLLESVARYIPERRPEVYRLLEQYGPGRQVAVFRSREEAQAWLAALPPRS